MRISKEKCEEIKKILGKDFIIVIAVPKELTEGQKSISGVDMVASMSKEAVEYCLTAAALMILEGKVPMWE